jgi:hypothetical protein
MKGPSARLRVFAVSVVTVGIACSIPLACAGKVTVPPETKTDAAPTTTTTSTATGSPEACARCVDAKCKATWDACVADAACSAQVDCIAACADADCESRCKSSRPSALGDAVQACFRGPCATDCTR